MAAKSWSLYPKKQILFRVINQLRSIITLGNIFHHCQSCNMQLTLLECPWSYWTLRYWLLDCWFTSQLCSLTTSNNCWETQPLQQHRTQNVRKMAATKHQFPHQAAYTSSLYSITVLCNLFNFSFPTRRCRTSNSKDNAYVCDSQMSPSFNSTESNVAHHRYNIDWVCHSWVAQLLHEDLQKHQA